jgi:phosphatidylserine/phosphatidylglycerophosphate/cardiolipin synthase-like enzyme
MRLLILLSLCAALFPGEEAAPVDGVNAHVYFSPNGGCTEAIVREIEAAKQSIRVQAYSFTSKPISAALKTAKERGVGVEVILDASQRTEKYSGADFIAHAGIPVLIDEKPAIAHSKVMIIDGSTVITGSFNFTSSAETRNVENLLVLRSTELAQRYLTNWLERQKASVSYIPKDEREK